ncbi:MAG: hypothetical protein HQK59_08300 [Deltaproteobacteria bacterium]|nr:hypothetical protein [Deltaproteobacteria bacterium]
MAHIIPFKGKSDPLDNVICSKPIRVRWGEWKGGRIMQCTNYEAEKFEQHRREVSRAGHGSHVSFVPTYFPLSIGESQTLLGLYQVRDREEDLDQVYYLAGLMECLLNYHQPVLRTDLIRKFYDEINILKSRLGVLWRGNSDHFLLPLASMHYDASVFIVKVEQATSMKELLAVIKEGTSEQLTLLKNEYVFYLPKDQILA